MFTRRKKTRLTAIVAACVAAAALASAALASTIDTLAPYNGPNNEYQLGATGNCKAGKAVPVGASLNWHDNTTTGTVAPEIDGDLCLQKTTGTFRIKLVYYPSSGDHSNPIGSYYGDKTVGNGSSLQTTAVAKQGPKVNVSAMNHIHAVIQEYDSSTSTWVDDTSNVIYATYH